MMTSEQQESSESSPVVVKTTQNDPGQLPEHIEKLLELNQEQLQELKESNINHKTKGNEHFKSNEYQSAIECYKEALLLNDDPELRAVCNSNLAACYLCINNYDEAVKTATIALEDKPDYLKALVRRMKANNKLNTSSSLTQAKNDATKILEQIDSNNSDAKLISKGIDIRIETLKEREKQEMLGKLKDIGNSLLGQFGLSTDMFNVDKSDGGSYSISTKK